MKGFKTCEKGHYYDENLAECPYCPKNSSPNEDAKTEVSSGAGDLGKTKISDGSESETVSNKSYQAPKQSSHRDLSKTFIQEVVEEETKDGGQKKVVSNRATRKIVGWIISYTLDPMGVDYRLYEGSNTLGRSGDNTISIGEDPSISSRHATVLFKKGRFFVRDEMAANGTFINGEELEIGNPSPIADGDKLKLGNTVFIFKSPF